MKPQIDETRRIFLKAAAYTLFTAVLPSVGCASLLKNHQGNLFRPDLDNYMRGKLSDEFYFDNFAPYIPKKDHAALQLYIKFCKKYRHQVYDGGRLMEGEGYTYIVRNEVAKFSRVAKYYTPEAQRVLDRFEDVQIDDIVVAYAVSNSSEFSQFLNNKIGLIQTVKSKVQKPIERKLDPKHFVTDVNQFPHQDLLKVYILQKYLVNNRTARVRIWNLIMEDLSPSFSDAEIGGGVILDPYSLMLTFHPVEGKRGNNDSYEETNPILYAETSTFSSFHLHAVEGFRNEQYSGPSVQDIHSSTLHHLQSGIVITPVEDKSFNVHYYRSLGKTPPLGLSFNLGSFSTE